MKLTKLDDLGLCCEARTKDEEETRAAIESLRRAFGDAAEALAAAQAAMDELARRFAAVGWKIDRARGWVNHLTERED